MNANKRNSSELDDTTKRQKLGLNTEHTTQINELEYFYKKLNKIIQNIQKGNDKYLLKYNKFYFSKLPRSHPIQRFSFNKLSDEVISHIITKEDNVFKQLDNPDPMYFPIIFGDKRKITQSVFTYLLSISIRYNINIIENNLLNLPYTDNTQFSDMLYIICCAFISTKNPYTETESITDDYPIIIDKLLGRYPSDKKIMCYGDTIYITHILMSMSDMNICNIIEIILNHINISSHFHDEKRMIDINKFEFLTKSFSYTISSWDDSKTQKLFQDDYTDMIRFDKYIEILSKHNITLPSMVIIKEMDRIEKNMNINEKNKIIIRNKLLLISD